MKTNYKFHTTLSARLMLFIGILALFSACGDNGKKTATTVVKTVTATPTPESTDSYVWPYESIGPYIQDGQLVQAPDNPAVTELRLGDEVLGESHGQFAFPPGYEIARQPVDTSAQLGLQVIDNGFRVVGDHVIVPVDVQNLSETETYDVLVTPDVGTKAPDGHVDITKPYATARGAIHDLGPGEKTTVLALGLAKGVVDGDTTIIAAIGESDLIAYSAP